MSSFGCSISRAGLTSINGWKDLAGSISQGTNAAALTYEAYRGTPLKLYYFRHNQTDELHFVYQMQHDWIVGTAVRPHMHVIPMAAPILPQVVSITGKYAWSQPGVAIPADIGWQSYNALLTVNPGDVYKEALIVLPQITPPLNLSSSMILMIYVARSSTDVADTYITAKDHGTPTANLALLSADIHYQAISVGTVSEF